MMEEVKGNLQYQRQIRWLFGWQPDLVFGFSGWRMREEKRKEKKRKEKKRREEKRREEKKKRRRQERKNDPDLIIRTTPTLNG